MWAKDANLTVVRKKEEFTMSRKVSLFMITITFLCCLFSSAWGENDGLFVTGQIIPMIAWVDGMDIYIYETATQTMQTVKENANDIHHFPSLNPDGTLLVYAEETGDDNYEIKVFDINTKATKTLLNASDDDGAAYFDENDKIIFNSEDGKLKRMNPDGSDVQTIASPEYPYSFSMFWISPDRGKIIVQENKDTTEDYHTGHYARLVLMNADGTGRKVIKPDYLGDWNMLTWNAGSNEVLFYHHIFKVVRGDYKGKIPKYVLITLSGKTTDLSNSNVRKKGNLCLFTKSGNLLSLMYHELYNGKTGKLIAVRPDVPAFTDAMWGIDNESDIYFADLEGNNFRKFIEQDLDLTGAWNALNLKCKSTKKGNKCNIKSKFTVQNTGTTDANTSKVIFYLSDDASFDQSDIYLKQVPIGKLKKGISKKISLNYNFSEGTVMSGKYIIALIDAENMVIETNEGNNQIPYGPM